MFESKERPLTMANRTRDDADCDVVVVVVVTTTMMMISERRSTLHGLQMSCI